MNVKLITLLILTSLLLVPVTGHCLDDEPAPYQFAILYPIQFVDEMRSIQGFRFNFIYGLNANVRGLDFGLINQVSDKQSGLQIGLINSSFKTSGVQLGLINKAEYLEGIQIGLLNFHNEGDLKILPGINFAF